jgi:hypothetical protein
VAGDQLRVVGTRRVERLDHGFKDTGVLRSDLDGGTIRPTRREPCTIGRIATAAERLERLVRAFDVWTARESHLS